MKLNTKAASLIEYAFVTTIISTLTIVSIVGFGGKIKETYNGVSQAMPGQYETQPPQEVVQFELPANFTVDPVSVPSQTGRSGAAFAPRASTYGQMIEENNIEVVEISSLLVLDTVVNFGGRGPRQQNLQTTFYFAGDTLDYLEQNTISCDSGYNFVVDDAVVNLYDPGIDHTQYQFNYQGSASAFPPGDVMRCTISSS